MSDNTALGPTALVEALERRNVRRVKLGITDMDGVIRGKYLSLEKFASVARSAAGFCDCIFGWDINDQLYDNVTFSSWDKGFPDAPYRVDLSSMRTLPSEPEAPFFIAELVPRDGEDFHGICPRNLFKKLVARAADLGFGVKLGFEFEFFLFNETPHSARAKHYRDLEPFTPGNCGYSVVRSSVHSELHQEFLDFCSAMRLDLEGYHTETGPGVMEAALAVQSGVEGADRAALFKTFAKVFFQRHGILPTFMAKWSPDYPGQSGHLHMSLTRDGSGAFHDSAGRASMSPLMTKFVAGQLKYMREMCAMVAPSINSYTRLVKGAWAPTAAAWAVDNRTTALRVIPGSEKSQRVEYRLAGADGNPYLVAAVALASGLQGIEEGLSLDDPITGNAYEVQDSLPLDRQLPVNLRHAAELFGASAVARQWFGDEFVDHFAASRTWEAREFERAITDWELQRYFEII